MNARVVAVVLLLAAAAGMGFMLMSHTPETPPLISEDTEVDEAGRLVFETPSPAVAANASTVTAVAIADGDNSQPVAVLRKGSTSKSRRIVISHSPVTVAPRGTPAPPPQPMPGCRDETWYIRNLPPGTSVEVPTETRPEGQQLRIVYGILASPATLENRVFPLLETALKDEISYVFIEKNDTFPQFAEAIRIGKNHIKSRGLNASMVHLHTIPEMKMSQRNSWMDLPVLRWMAEQHRFNTSSADVDWFAIVDDDTYPITAAVREILAQYTNSKHPLVIADMLRWGEGGGWRLVRMRDGQRKFIPSTKRQPITFPCGGGGIFLNLMAVKRIYRFLNSCIDKHFHPAGDLRLGACLADARIPLIRRREFVKDVHFRAIGDLHLDHQFAFPAAFHRLRSPTWYTELRELEVKAGRWGIVHWDAIRAEFPPGEKDHFHSIYYPSDYENCTAIFGVRPTPKPYNPKIKWGKKGLPPLPPSRGNPQADEWGGCKIFPTTKPPTRA